MLIDLFNLIIQGQLFGLWKQYVRREITASQLLRECAFVYGPPAQ
jgi:hypothetical protein